MAELFTWLPEETWRRFLVDAAWQSILVAGVMLHVLRFIRRPALRSTCAWLAIVAAVIVAPLSSAVRYHGLGILPVQTPIAVAPPADMVVIEAPPSDAVNLDIPEPEVAAQPIIVPAAAPEVQRDWSLPTAKQIIWPTLAALWMVLSALALMRLALAGWSLQRWSKRTTDCQDATWLEAMQTAADKLRLRRLPRLLVCQDLDVPTLLPGWTPQLVVPNGRETPTAAACLAICCHELAHVKRGDRSGRVVVELLTCLLPWQPLIWQLRRKYIDACEEACDDWCVAAGTDPVDLAAILTEWIPRRTPPLALAMAGSESETRTRILRLLAMRTTPRPRAGAIRLMAVAILTVMGTAALAMLQVSAAQEVDVEPPQTSLLDDTESVAAEEKERQFKRLVEAARAAELADNEARRRLLGPIEEKIKFLQQEHERLKELHELGARGGEFVNLTRVEYELAVAKTTRARLQGQVLTAWIRQDEAVKAAQRYFDATEAAFQTETVTHNAYIGARIALDREKANLARMQASLRGGQTEQESNGETSTVTAVPIPERQPATSATLPPYRINPPDVLRIKLVAVSPANEPKIRPGERLEIEASGTLTEHPIHDTYRVEAGGTVNLGIPYGRVSVTDYTCEEAEAKILDYLKKKLSDPRVSVSFADVDRYREIESEHLVDPSGRINLGRYGQVHVAGLTSPLAEEAIETHLESHDLVADVVVEISQYNSAVYYVIQKDEDAGDTITRFPVTGNDTVLDALAQVPSLERLETKQIRLLRPVDDDGKKVEELEVDWKSISSGESDDTNYRLQPGDRVVVYTTSVEPKNTETDLPPSLPE